MYSRDMDITCDNNDAFFLFMGGGGKNEKKSCSFKKLYNSDGIVCIISYFRDHAIFLLYAVFYRKKFQTGYDE